MTHGASICTAGAPRCRGVITPCFCKYVFLFALHKFTYVWNEKPSEAMFTSPRHSLIFASTWVGIFRSTPRKKEGTLAALELRGCSSHYLQHRESAAPAVPLSQGALSRKRQWRDGGLQRQVDVHKPLRIPDRSYDTLTRPRRARRPNIPEQFIQKLMLVQNFKVRLFILFYFT